MAQWYAQLVFKGDTLLGEGATDLGDAIDMASPNGGERYTTVIVSGYALYGQLRGYYSLGIAHVTVDPGSKRVAYVSETSALHKEPVGSLTPGQRAAIRDWLMRLNLAAWENSTEVFRRELERVTENG